MSDDDILAEARAAFELAADAEAENRREAPDDSHQDGNGASHFVGSWGVHGERRGARIDWDVENDTDTTSFLYGRPLRKVGLPTVPSYARPRRGGRTHQTIQFSTDLEGVPLHRQR